MNWFPIFYRFLVLKASLRFSFPQFVCVCNWGGEFQTCSDRTNSFKITLPQNNAAAANKQTNKHNEHLYFYVDHARNTDNYFQIHTENENDKLHKPVEVFETDMEEKEEEVKK